MTTKRLTATPDPSDPSAYWDLEWPSGKLIAARVGKKPGTITGLRVRLAPVSVPLREARRYAAGFADEVKRCGGRLQDFYPVTNKGRVVPYPEGPIPAML